MADCNHTPLPAATGATETITDLLAEISIRGCDAIEMAGLLELCSRDIYKELTAISELYPGALVEHAQALTDHIDFLVRMLRDMGGKIDDAADAVGDAMKAEGGAS